jgi:osmotically-inducible protein OsmY
MPHFPRKRGFAALALLLAALGCAPSAARESVDAQIGDSVITSKVKAAISNDPALKVFRIDVETYRNVVQLSGFVSSSTDMDKAVRHARTVTGVSSVRNDMRLR